MDDVFQVINSKGVISFQLRKSALSGYPQPWWQFDFMLNDEIRICYDMDTGTILLRYADLQGKNTLEALDDYRKVLTKGAFDRDQGKSILPILNLFPNGNYTMKIGIIEKPYLITSDMLREEDGLNIPQPRPFDKGSRLYFNLDSILSIETEPSLLIPTIDVKTCNNETISKYIDQINSTDDDGKPLLLLFREPNHYDVLHDQYHPEDEIYKESIHDPPDFGFNGNHIYFADRNYYILDGHHKAVAYKESGKDPHAIIIECMNLADGSYPA